MSPRHDRAYGISVPTKRSGGGSGRRTRKRGKNTYAAKQNRKPSDDTEKERPATPQAAEPQGAQRRQQGPAQTEVGQPA